VLEVLAHDAHARDQSIVEDFLDRTSLGEGVSGHLLDFVRLALVEALVHESVINHGYRPCQVEKWKSRKVEK
jgi:hypothetical protein